MPSGPVLLAAIVIAVGFLVVSEVKTGIHKLGCKVHLVHNCQVKQP